MSSVRLGIDRVLAGEADHLRSEELGLILHPASVTSDLTLDVDALLEAGFPIRTLFGPQHGARGEKQDNMIESDHYRDPNTGLPVHSLYSEVRKPTPEMLDGLTAVLFDLQDVGVRIYTFIWTMALAMEACGEAGVRFVVLDRPNPIGGVLREGPLLREGFESFVGLHPTPLRHGLTVAEIARWLRESRGIDCELEVVTCDGWSREDHWRETGLPWVMPSPNLPTLEGCDVYPGMVLFEGTNLSEGRGTTRPFELFGAPWVDPTELAGALNGSLGPGVTLRPCHFEPTFQKHAGRVCGGGQLHVTDPDRFEPVRAAVALLAALSRLYPDDFAWRPPPYEYEAELMPIDILWGGDGLRVALDDGATVDDVLDGAAEEVEAFSEAVGPHQLYD